MTSSKVARGTAQAGLGSPYHPAEPRTLFATVDHDLSITTDDENEFHNKN